MAPVARHRGNLVWPLGLLFAVRSNLFDSLMTSRASTSNAAPELVSRSGDNSPNSIASSVCVWSLAASFR